VFGHKIHIIVRRHFVLPVFFWVTPANAGDNWGSPVFSIWTGQAYSLLGTSLVGSALVWWLASTSTSATVLAGGTLMMVLPQIVLGPLMGALVDRWNRRVLTLSFSALGFLISAVRLLEQRKTAPLAVGGQG
jgi:MFS family permease